MSPDMRLFQTRRIDHHDGLSRRPRRNIYAALDYDGDKPRKPALRLKAGITAKRLLLRFIIRAGPHVKRGEQGSHCKSPMAVVDCGFAT